MTTPAGRAVAFDFPETLRVLWSVSLLVFLRRDIGIRILHCRAFAIMAVLVIAFFCWLEGRFDIPVTIFVGTAAVLAIVHDRRHARRLKAFNPAWHTWSVGRSTIFSSVPLPGPFVRGAIEPAVCFALGWWLKDRHDTLYLGWWIMGAAVMLFFVERTVRIALRERIRDVGDTFVESEGFAHVAAAFAEQAAKQAERWQSKRRRRRTAPPPAPVRQPAAKAKTDPPNVIDFPRKAPPAQADHQNP